MNLTIVEFKVGKNAENICNLEYESYHSGI